MSPGFIQRRRTRILSLVFALAAAAALALFLLLLLSESFALSADLFFFGPFRSPWAFGNLLSETSVLIIAGLAAAIAFGSRNFNLGGEGQVYLGAIAAAATCLSLPGLPGPAGIALGLLAGASSGAAMAWISARLKLDLGVDELISSFLLSAALVHVGDFLVSGPLQDPASNFQSTASVPAAFALARLFPPSTLSTAAFVALLLLFAATFVKARTRFGFELEHAGRNPLFARYAGMDTRFHVAAPLTISGALYGLAGALLVLGTYHKVVKGFSAGLGWTGISVALVAGNSPAAVLPSAFLFAWLEAGSKTVMVGSDLTGDIVSVIQAAVFFLVTARVAEGLFARAPGRHGRKKHGGGEGR